MLQVQCVQKFSETHSARSHKPIQDTDTMPQMALCKPVLCLLRIARCEVKHGIGSQVCSSSPLLLVIPGAEHNCHLHKNRYAQDVRLDPRQPRLGPVVTAFIAYL